MACERHVGFQPAGSRPVSPNEGRLCPLADGAGECEARASSNAGEEIEEEAAEIPAVRPQAVPAGPSEKERLEHLPLHEPYRSWCATCVAGRAVSDRHIWQPHPEGALAIVGLDYGYLAPRGEPEERCTPILFGKDSRHKWFYAIPMPSKGITEPWCAQAVASSVSRAGFGRLSFRSDTEPAIVALKRVVGHILTTKFGTEIVPEEASMGDSSSNGLAEHAVREVKAKARSLAHGLKRLLGQELEPTHPVVTWLIQWAAMTINIGRRGIDGKTPWERRHGRPCRRSIAEFGEKILWLPTGKHKSHLDERYLPGVFLGIALHSNDIMVGRENGSVGLARSFRRLPESQRVDVMLLRGVRGVPWCPDPQVGAEVEVAVAPAPLVREVDLPPDPPPAAAPEPRRVYIRRVELMKHGFTPGCPGCEAAQAGTPPRGHTEPCRVRIETAMRGDKDGGEARVARAEIARAVASGSSMEIETDTAHHWRHRRNHHPSSSSAEPLAWSGNAQHRCEFIEEENSC